MKALILFTLIAFQTFQSLCFNMQYQCPDDKIQLDDDICGIEVSSTTDDIFYVKKKCGKNQQIDFIKGITISKKTHLYYRCVTKLNLLEVGKSCFLDSECITSNCANGKCATVSACTGDKNCGKGKYCYRAKDKYGIEAETGSCKDYVKEKGECGGDEGKECGPGLICYKQDYNSPKGTCTKLYSLELGARNVEDSRLCISGATFTIKRDNIKLKECVTLTDSKIVTAGVIPYCQVTYTDKSNGKYEDNSAETFINKAGSTVCKEDKRKYNLLGDIKERYDDIDLEKLLEKEEDSYAYHGFFGDKKYAELYSVYEKYSELLDKGIIEDDGKKNDDNSCGYEFWFSTISSSNVNVGLGFVFALLGLLL